jgi:hypothetical protein
MSVYPNPRIPARGDDELAMDRPDRQPWREVDADAVPVRRQRYDDAEPVRRPSYPGVDLARQDADRPIVVAQQQRAPTVLDGVSRGLGLLLKLMLLLILLACLWGMVSLIGMSVRTPGAIGEQIGSAIERGAGILGSAGQRVTDAFDPAHPPRQSLAQDVEIDELMRLNVGAQVSGSSTRDLTIASIQRRADPSGPDGAVYAVLHGELREAKDTKILGVTVTSSRDPKDYYLYKGETVRIGRKLYKVNWVSVERQQVALIAYRDQDRVTAPLKAEID